MALTTLQRHVCRLLAEQRKQRGESYVAGGGALNELLGGAELDALELEGIDPEAAELSRRWREAVTEAREIVRVLLSEQVGRCALDHHGGLEKMPSTSILEKLFGG